MPVAAGWKSHSRMMTRLQWAYISINRTIGTQATVQSLSFGAKGGRLLYLCADFSASVYYEQESALKAGEGRFKRDSVAHSTPSSVLIAARMTGMGD